MKERKGNTILLSIIAIATLLVAVVGTTFAYFTAVLSGAETTTQIRVSSGTLGTVFEGGAVISVSNIFPRVEKWHTKTFSIKYTSSAPNGTVLPYTLSWEIDSNTFTAGHLTYTFKKNASSTANGTFATNKDTQTIIPSSGSVALGSGKLLAPTTGEAVHTYDIEIFFPNDVNNPQNLSQGKEFKSHIKIEQPHT